MPVKRKENIVFDRIYETRIGDKQWKVNSRCGTRPVRKTWNGQGRTIFARRQNNSREQKYKVSPES